MAVLRVTRLHVFLGIIGGVLLTLGALALWNEYQSLKPKPADVTALPYPDPAANTIQVAPKPETRRQAVAQSIATVGEAYRVIQNEFGDVLPISRPLHLAKVYQEQGKTAEAMNSAREAWTAVKTFRAKAGTVGRYQVTPGDTLWKIAATRSPVRSGNGWVAVWKANQKLIRDFDQLEVGWVLSIPTQRSQYVTPFWKPQK